MALFQGDPPFTDRIKYHLDLRNWVTPNIEATTFGEAYKKARGSGLSKFNWNYGRYDTKYAGTPAEQMRETGITDDLIRSSGGGGLYNFRRSAAKNIEPLHGWRSLGTSLISAFTNRSEHDVRKMIDPGYKKESTDYQKWEKDALRLSFGFPQRHDTFKVSEYRPTRGKNIADTSSVYYALNNPENRQQIFDEIFSSINFTKINPENWKKKISKEQVGTLMNLGRITVDEEEDEKGRYLSMYDIQDYNPFGTKMNWPAKGFEIYDRAYFEEKGHQYYPIKSSKQ